MDIHSDDFFYITPIGHANNNVYENLCQPYEAEFSTLTGEVPNASGIYKMSTPVHGKDASENVFGYLGYIGKTPIGFRSFTKKPTHYEGAEFYILPSFRLNNRGRAFSNEVFKRHPGVWVLRQIRGADYATRFWRKIIEDVDKNYKEDMFEDPRWGQVTRQTFVVPTDFNPTAN